MRTIRITRSLPNRPLSGQMPVRARGWCLRAALFMAVCALIAFGTFTPASGQKAVGEGPTTIAGCKKKFKPHTGERASCIFRVETEKSKCKLMPKAPCIGPIESLYSMDGFGTGQTKLIWASRVGQGSFTQRSNGDRVERQPWVCHTASKVKIVAVIIVHTAPHERLRYQRMPHTAHSCKVTQVWLHSADHETAPEPGAPTLLLEGKRTR